MYACRYGKESSWNPTPTNWNLMGRSTTSTPPTLLPSSILLQTFVLLCFHSRWEKKIRARCKKNYFLFFYMVKNCVSMKLCNFASRRGVSVHLYLMAIMALRETNKFPISQLSNRLQPRVRTSSWSSHMLLKIDYCNPRNTRPNFTPWSRNIPTKSTETVL